MDALSFLLGYHKGKAQGSSGGLIETDVFSSQPVTGFTEDFDFPGAYFAASPVSFGLDVNETYYVEWDDVTYTCKGTSGSLGEITSIYIGNGEMLAHPGNDEPFAIVCVDDTTIQFIAFDDDKSEHTVRIYQKKSGVTVETLNVTQNGEYPAPEGVAYSSVHVDVAVGTVDFPFGLEEIYPETELTFSVGVSTYLPQTPVAILADQEQVKNGSVKTIANGESGLVIWDGKLYAVYAGLRSTPKIQFPFTASTVTVDGSIGNIGIPSAWMGGTVVEDTRNYGSSNEPFLIVANSSAGFLIAIPENSTTLTHTIQIFKFVKEQTNE